MCLITASTATPALSLDSSVASATASIKSFLLISIVLVGWEGVGHGLDSSVVPGADISRCKGSGERETTLKDHCRQAEIAENRPIFGQNCRRAGAC